MKELWSILMDKLRQIEPNFAALGIGIFSLFTLWMSTLIVLRFFTMIIEVVTAFSGKPLV